MAAASEIQKVCVKLALDAPGRLNADPMLEIFARWRTEEGEELVDLADYAHLAEGPLVVLIGHRYNLAVDTTGGEPGIQYCSKKGLAGTTAERFVAVFRATLAKTRRLLAEPGPPGGGPERPAGSPQRRWGRPGNPRRPLGGSRSPLRKGGVHPHPRRRPLPPPRLPRRGRGRRPDPGRAPRPPGLRHFQLRLSTPKIAPVSREKLSAVVVARDESRQIRECLRALRFADEIVVLDCGSADATVEIARELADRVIPFPAAARSAGGAPGGPPPLIHAAKNFAFAEAAGPWILNLDADERPTDELRDEILKTLESPDPRLAAYSIPFTHYFFGRYLRHGGFRGPLLRLFR